MLSHSETKETCTFIATISEIYAKKKNGDHILILSREDNMTVAILKEELKASFSGQILQNVRLNFTGYWPSSPWKSHFIINGITPLFSSHLKINPQLEEDLTLWLELLRPALRSFVMEVMESDEGRALCMLPASHNHHHNQTGGLLTHSIECAMLAGQIALLWLNRAEAEVTM